MCFAHVVQMLTEYIQKWHISIKMNVSKWQMGSDVWTVVNKSKINRPTNDINSFFSFSLSFIVSWFVIFRKTNFHYSFCLPSVLLLIHFIKNLYFWYDFAVHSDGRKRRHFQGFHFQLKVAASVRGFLSFYLHFVAFFISQMRAHLYKF